MKYLRGADEHLIAYLQEVQLQQFPSVFIPGATTNNCKKRDAPMKVLQAYSGEETQTVWMGTIKRLLHRYLEHRNQRRTFRRACAENDIGVLRRMSLVRCDRARTDWRYQERPPLAFLRCATHSGPLEPII